MSEHERARMIVAAEIFAHYVANEPPDLSDSARVRLSQEAVRNADALLVALGTAEKKESVLFTNPGTGEMVNLSVPIPLIKRDPGELCAEMAVDIAMLAQIAGVPLGCGSRREAVEAIKRKLEANPMLDYDAGMAMDLSKIYAAAGMEWIHSPTRSREADIDRIVELLEDQKRL